MPLDLSSLARAAFLIFGMSIAGIFHSAWLKIERSHRFALPLDGGRTLRGRRILGDNKTLRGILVIVPAAGAAFPVLSLVLEKVAYPDLLWSLTPAGYAALGVCAAAGFMAGELPNSFLKRQLDILPGLEPAHPFGRVLAFLADRFDSAIGMLCVVSLLVPTPVLIWLYVLIAGPLVHWAFSYLLYRLGVKRRAS
jgi:hypothetical protein